MPLKNTTLARPLAVASFLAALALAACGGGGGTPGGGGGGGGPTPSPTSSPTPVPTPSYSPSGEIGHVVVIIQENRSFDNLFNGFPGADTVQTGYWHSQQVPLTPFDLWQPYSVDHTHGAFKHGYDDGLMDGFGDVSGGDFGGGSDRRRAAARTSTCRDPKLSRTGTWPRNSQSPTRRSSHTRARAS